MNKARFNVGYSIHQFGYRPVTGHTLDFDRAGVQGDTRDVTVAIWYPSTDEEQTYDYGGDPSGITGSVALDGEPDRSEAPYPLVVFSHGGAACGTTSRYLAECITSHGYIFAAPDHLDATLGTIRGGHIETRMVYHDGRLVPEAGIPWMDFFRTPGFNPYTDFPTRPQDISAVITYMLRYRRSPLHRMVDRNAVAVSGHSLGGWTAQALAGVVPDGCEYMVDGRAKACLFLAPNTEWTSRYAADRYVAMAKPVMYLLGELDQLSQSDLQTPRSDGYNAARPPKFMPIIVGMNHFEFTDWPTCAVLKTTDRCLRFNSKVGAVTKYGGAFLDASLKGDSSAQVILTAPDDMLVVPYEYEI